MTKQMTLAQVAYACSNPTLKEHIRLRDWKAIAASWHITSTSGHGLPLIKAEWRQTLVDEARKDGADLPGMAA